MVVASLSCVRFGQMRRFSSQTGTCDGACRHYLDCKDDSADTSLRTCMAECSDIFVHEGEPDRDSLRVFESLECEAAVGFVEGNDDGRSRTATSRSQAKGRSQAK